MHLLSMTRISKTSTFEEILQDRFSAVVIHEYLKISDL
jgi:hypothetical protein